MSSGVLKIIFVSVALLGALASAGYYVVGVVTRDRALSRAAAFAYMGFAITAAVCLWMFR